MNISENSLKNLDRTGGRRAGSGRKKISQTRVKEWLIEREIADAKSAYIFLVKTMKNPAEGKLLRIDCAKEILNRVLGRAKIQVESQSLKEFIVEIVKFGNGTSSNPL